MHKAEADKYIQALISVKREQVPVPTSVEDSDRGSGAFLYSWIRVGGNIRIQLWDEHPRFLRELKTGLWFKILNFLFIYFFFYVDPYPG